MVVTVVWGVFTAGAVYRKTIIAVHGMKAKTNSLMFPYLNRYKSPDENLVWAKLRRTLKSSLNPFIL